MRFAIIPAFLLVLGCAGDKDDENSGDTGPVTGDDDDTMGDDDDTMPMGGFTLQSTAVDAATGTPAAKGLCVDLLDPSPAILGKPAEILMSSTVGANGAIEFTDVSTTSTLGLLQSVKDCATSNTTVYTTATGVLFEDYDGLGDGDTLSGQTAFSIDMAFLAGMQASAEAIGFAGNLETDGMMFGYVFDNTGTPVGGATVTCADCDPTYYMDANAKDGLFSSLKGANAATDPYAGAVWIIPAGPIGQYQADDGGVHTFTAQLNGSNPGSATATALFAD